MIYDLIVVGGGVSGMVAAICAARRGKRVLILEKGERIGRKLLATGNGKCNLGNLSPVDGKYNSDFPVKILKRYDLEAQCRFLLSLGLVTREVEGRVYPYGEQASIVLNAMRKELDALGVIVKTGEGAERITDNFIVNGKYEGNNLLLAGGSSASFGFDSGALLAGYGHESKSLVPALVPLLTDKNNLKGLKGIRVEARVKLTAGEKLLGEIQDEIIFKDNGVSGTAVFALSQVLARARSNKKCTLHIDFAPEFGGDELYSMFARGITPDGMFHRELAAAMRRAAEAEGRDIVSVVKDYVLEGVATGSATLAQVMNGGLLTKDFCDDSCESKLVKGLFASGEVLDVDGECGGFNLMWAIASGMAVGEICGSR